MSQPPASIVHINIHNMELQASNVLISGPGGNLTQRNIVHHHAPVAETRANADHFTPCRSSATERRIEAQPRIRRKLQEVSSQTEPALSRIRRVASLATGILSVVEQESVSFSKSLVDLAMDAYAIAYIVVISFIYRRLRMSRTRVDKLNELLDIIHAHLVQVAFTGNIVSLFKRFVTRNQRKIQSMRMHEDLFKMLRKIEKNNDADVLSSLNDALDYHHQHCSVNTEE